MILDRELHSLEVENGIAWPLGSLFRNPIPSRLAKGQNTQKMHLELSSICHEIRDQALVVLTSKESTMQTI